MRAYIIRRLLLVVPTLFILSVLVFLSVRFIPGDVIDIMASRTLFVGGQLDRAAIEQRLGLDLPIHVQYGRWIGGILLRGTLGESLLGGWRIEERMLLELQVLALGPAEHVDEVHHSVVYSEASLQPTLPSSKHSTRKLLFFWGPN